MCAVSLIVVNYSINKLDYKGAGKHINPRFVAFARVEFINSCIEDTKSFCLSLNVDSEPMQQNTERGDSLLPHYLSQLIIRIEYLV